MPSGVHFSTETKEIFFRIIDFVEAEKTGPKIPLYNTTDRLLAMLGISHASLFRLKQEMQRQREEQEPRSLRSSNRLVTPNSHRKRSHSAYTPTSKVLISTPATPKTRGKHTKQALSEEAESEIRYQFSLLLSKRIYPTVSILLEAIHIEHPDFPIASVTSLRRYMHRLGFTYKSTTKGKLPFDSNSMVAQRAYFFRKMDHLRQENAHVYYHDETWCNMGEEKKSIWFNDSGEGRLRKTAGKGKRHFD